MEVQQPDTAWESVAFGAVKCELLGFGFLMSLRMARYNIGLTTNAPWDRTRFLPEQKIRNRHNGHHYAASAILWSLRRNEGLQKDKKVTTTMEGFFWEEKVDQILDSSTSPKVLKSWTKLVASDQDEAPQYPTRHTRSFATVVIPWDVSHFPKNIFPLMTSATGRPYRTVEFELEMRQSMAGMKFVVRIGDKLVGELIDVQFHSPPESIDGAEKISRQRIQEHHHSDDWSEADGEWGDDS